MENKIFINQKEAAELLGVSRQTISKISFIKGFPCTRLKRRVLINKEKLLKWVEENPNIIY